MIRSLLVLPLLLSSCVLVLEGDAHDGGDLEPERTLLDVEGRADDLPFRHVARVGDTVYLAGTLGLDPETGQAPEDVSEEVTLMLDAFQAKLEAAELTMDDLVWVQVFCADVALYDAFNEIYRTYFEGDFPARTFVGSGTLLRGARFEINGIAAMARWD